MNNVIFTKFGDSDPCCDIGDMWMQCDNPAKAFVHILHVIYMSATNADIKKNFWVLSIQEWSIDSGRNSAFNWR